MVSEGFINKEKRRLEEAKASPTKHAQCRQTEFEGRQFPIDDVPMIVRCVHESICPICGREGFIVDEWEVSRLQDWDDRFGMTVECTAGHKASAEPERHGDWAGWIGG